MKRAKVRLVQRMKEESNRHRNTELRRNKELSQMKKATRKNESRIKVRFLRCYLQSIKLNIDSKSHNIQFIRTKPFVKALEAEKRMKETVLKRKQEEVEMLRRNQRKAGMGLRVVGGVRSAGAGSKAFFSEKAAKVGMAHDL